MIRKKNAKRVMHRFLKSSIPPLIVASMGRSGSSLFWKAAAEATARKRFGENFLELSTRIVSDEAWDLHTTPLYGGVVYKTHALAHELPNQSRLRVVFLYGSPTDAALSVVSCMERYGESWIDEHFQHLRASGAFEEIGNQDVLRFNDQLDGWISDLRVERMVLKYETMWDYEAEINAFTGLDIRLPPKKLREGALANRPEIRERFSETYADLESKVKNLPECQIFK